MKYRSNCTFIILLTVIILSVNRHCGTVYGKSTRNPKSSRTNVLLLCIDDLRPELRSFGASYIKSPNIDRLAQTGRAFHSHYVNAPSCGPSRYTLLTGRYGPAGNDALFERAEIFEKEPKSVLPSMPEWFRQHGYTTVSVGKVSHHPGGRGGKDWDDDSVIEMPNAWDRHLMPVAEWQHPRGAMHGLANGEIRIKAGQMDVFQSVPGPDTIYPDGLITNESIKQLEMLAADDSKPFFLAVGIIKPHLPFGAPQKYMDLYDDVQLPPIPHPEKPTGLTTWHGSGEFMKYNRWDKDPRSDQKFADEVRMHYAACVSYADAQVGRVLETLKATGADKNTIIILWGDHGWHLGEHAIWGKHSLFEESLRSPMIIYYPEIDKPGVKTDAVVETMDIFPTLCDLTGVPKPAFIHGVSLQPQLENPEAQGHPAVAYWKRAKTIRDARYRLVVHNDGSTELYDHATPKGEAETLNIAQQHPEVVNELKKTLDQRLQLKEATLIVQDKKEVSEKNQIQVIRDDSNLTIQADGQSVLSYHYAVQDVPKGVGPAYRRSGFIHPLYSPSGRVLTRIQPPDHYHHYGIWAPWTKTHIEGKEVDFWNLKKKHGTVRFAELLSSTSDSAEGGFTVLQEHVQFLPDDTDRVVLNEVLDVRAAVANVENKRVWVIDLVSQFRNLLSTPVVLDQYRYGGGLGFRATEQWNKDNCTVLTSEGKTRNDADGTRARWCDVRGGFRNTNQTSGILFMSHPDNHEHPEPMRVWPDKIIGNGQMFFEFCPIRLKGWTLEPNKEYVLRYRMIVYDGKLKPESMEALWQSYSNQTVVMQNAD